MLNKVAVTISALKLFPSIIKQWFLNHKDAKEEIEKLFETAWITPIVYDDNDIEDKDSPMDDVEEKDDLFNEEQQTDRLYEQAEERKGFWKGAKQKDNLYWNKNENPSSKPKPKKSNMSKNSDPNKAKKPRKQLNTSKTFSEDLLNPSQKPPVKPSHIISQPQASNQFSIFNPLSSSTHPEPPSSTQVEQVSVSETGDDSLQLMNSHEIICLDSEEDDSASNATLNLPPPWTSPSPIPDLDLELEDPTIKCLPFHSPLLFNYPSLLKYLTP